MKPNVNRFLPVLVFKGSFIFPTVDVPDHAHYAIGVVILVVGITGMLGNFLVIYAFCRYPFSVLWWTHISVN